MMVAWCNRCKLNLPTGRFDERKREPGKLKSMCKRCCRAVGQQVRDNKLASGEKFAGTGVNYKSRNAWLSIMGFSSYPEYLKSDLWKKTRDRVFQEKGHDCWLCGAPATQVHHNRYGRHEMSGKRTKYLIPVCSGCHCEIEFDSNKKVSVIRARSKARKKRKIILKS